MNEPSDFGLGPVETLATVIGCPPAEGHHTFWQSWRERIEAAPADLQPIESDADGPDPRDPTGTHTFESLTHTRIGATLSLPPRAADLTAGLVTLHGAPPGATLGQESERWSGFTDRGLAVLSIRVRGWPGSSSTAWHCGDDPDGSAWIEQGLYAQIAGPRPQDGAADWVVPLAVGDVICAVRALRSRIGTEKPIFLLGESLGGGLAVLAAAQLRAFEPVQRLVLGLPSLGGWEWRIERQAWGGLGQGVQRVLSQHERQPEALTEVTRRLGLADACRMGREVTCPALAKLALRDEVVPAPASAAVYNSLGVSAGEKWRFLVPYGHFDGGIANARRHALFERVVADFLDPGRTPGEAMAAWEDKLGEVGVSGGLRRAGSEESPGA